MTKYRWLFSDGSWKVYGAKPDHNTFLSQYFVSVSEVHDETLNLGACGVGSDVHSFGSPTVQSAS